MKLNNLAIIIPLFLTISSCTKEDVAPHTPEKVVIFYDDFIDKANWIITEPWDSVNNISIFNHSMTASVVSTKPAMLGSIADAVLNDSMYIDSTITRFGLRIKLIAGDIHYKWNWPPHGNNGILFNLNWGYYTIRIPRNCCGENVNINLPLGKEYIVDYNNGKVTFFVDGIQFDEKNVTAFKNTNGYSSPPMLQVIMEGYFIDDISYKHKVQIDFIEFYIYK